LEQVSPSFSLFFAQYAVLPRLLEMLLILDSGDADELLG
jgi:hypothetical protein